MRTLMVMRTAKIGILAISILPYLLLTSCSSPGDEPRSVVDDGLFLNEVYASGEDWIELYNSLETSIDIGGYFIYDSETKKYSLPAGTSITPKGFLVLRCNDLNSGLNTNFQLTSSGETVYLENTSGTLINQVTFPAINAGQSYGRYPDGSSTLAVSGNTTRGVSNGDSWVPAIAAVSRQPLVPGLNQPVAVNVTFISTTGIASVKLFHRFNGGVYASLNMILSGDAYTATLPTQAATGLVEYYVEAKDAGGKVTYKPASAPANVYNYLLNTDALPQLVVNEFMAFNLSCCPDVDGGVNEYDDWIEIYNAGNFSVNIGDMYFSDDLTNPFSHRIPNDTPSATTIQPGGYLVLWADNRPSQGVLHLDFALNTIGEAVGLYYLDGRTIDTYTFQLQHENISWGRSTDGAANWKAFTAPTPGSANR